MGTGTDMRRAERVTNGASTVAPAGARGGCMTTSRTAKFERKTKETEVSVEVALDGGAVAIDVPERLLRPHARGAGGPWRAGAVGEGEGGHARRPPPHGRGRRPRARRGARRGARRAARRRPLRPRLRAARRGAGARGGRSVGPRLLRLALPGAARRRLRDARVPADPGRRLRPGARRPGTADAPPRRARGAQSASRGRGRASRRSRSRCARRSRGGAGDGAVPSTKGALDR